MTSARPTNINSFSQFLSTVGNYGDLPSISTSDKSIFYSYTELYKEVYRFSDLLSKDISEGERVVIANIEGPYWVITFLSLVLIKAVAVPIDRRMPRELQREIVELVSATKVITTDQSLDLGLKKIIFKRENNKSSSFRAPDLSNETVAEILFTSGTWGKPKGVVLTHGNLLANLNSIRKVYQPKQEEIALSVLPLSHAYEQMAGLLVPLASGCHIVYQKDLDKTSLLSSMKEFKVNYMVVVPRFLEILEQKIKENLQNKEGLFNFLVTFSKVIPTKGKNLIFKPVHRSLGGSLHTFVVGGAPLGTETDKFFRNLGFNIFVGYGLTETAPVLAVSLEKRRSPNSVGTPLPGVSIKISSEGEILASGKNISPGYWPLEKQTKNKWFATGDLGYLDNSGKLIITGRKKNLAVFSTGDKIQLEDIEDLANKFPKVTESCAVYSSGLKPTLGLFYVGSCPQSKLRSYLNENLPLFARLSFVEKWPEETLPRSHTLKLKRDLIQSYFENERSAL